MWITLLRYLEWPQKWWGAGRDHPAERRVIRDKIQVQEEIQTMTAARIFEQKIMNGIPFGMILYIDFTSPGFFDIMYGTWMGRLIMTLCLAFYMGAVMLSGKILDIEI